MPGALHEDQYTFLSHLAQFSLERNIFQTKVVENIETGVLYSVTFFRKSSSLWNMWKNMVKPNNRLQMTIWCMPIACWILKSTNIFRICNTYGFYTATGIARTRLNVTLYVHCVSGCTLKWVVHILSTGLHTDKPTIHMRPNWDSVRSFFRRGWTEVSPCKMGGVNGLPAPKSLPAPRQIVSRYKERSVFDCLLMHTLWAGL